MIIYFFIPQISETNEDRGAGAREEREPGRSGSPGGAGAREEREAGSIKGRDTGAEIEKAVLCCLLLPNIQSKTRA